MKPLFVTFILIALTGCSPSSPTKVAPVLPPLAVRVVHANADVVASTLAISGIVRPLDRAAIAANVMGRIKVARLSVGQSVAAGEILVEIEVGELNARLAQAQAILGQAERDYARESELESKGAAARESARASEDRLRIARAGLAEAEAMQAYLKIAAPFDGVITSDLVNPGDLATPGETLFELEGITNLRAEVQVPESLPVPDLGTTVMVTFDHSTVAGRLVELSPASDSQSRTRLAKIALPADPATHSGQFVRADWPVGTVTTLTIPASAVSRFGQMERVFVVSGNQARLRLVRTGATRGDRVEVLSGLEPRETVVLAPSAILRDGQSVEILP